MANTDTKKVKKDGSRPNKTATAGTDTAYMYTKVRAAAAEHSFMSAFKNTLYFFISGFMNGRKSGIRSRMS